MLAILEDLKARGVEVIPQGNNILIHPASRMPPELKERLRAQKAEVLAFLKTASAGTKPSTCAPSCLSADTACPKSDPQFPNSSPQCPGPEVCAGCYSVGVIDGRERFIHPPKFSPEWKAWLKRWEPKGRIQ